MDITEYITIKQSIPAKIANMIVDSRLNLSSLRFVQNNTNKRLQTKEMPIITQYKRESSMVYSEILA